jgi:vancomycin resistance protein YoaR
MLQDYLWDRKKLIYSCGIIILLIVVVGIWAGTLLAQKTFYEGIYVENINASGLAPEEVEKLLINKNKEMYDHQELTLLYGKKNWKINIVELYPKFQTAETLGQAYNLGRTGNLYQRIYHIISLKLHKVNFLQQITLDDVKLASFLGKIKKEIDITGKNASIEYIGSDIITKKETIGRILDIDKNISLVENQIGKRDFHPLELFVERKAPDVTFDDIKNINCVLGSAATKFNAYDTDRTHNIKLACARLNNIILKTNDMFSMNQVLGPRTLKNGYRDAPVIFMNELIKGPGGGVCQVTTTLYDAVLKSKLEIIERSHHSMPLGYVEPGQDATIAENYIDFKFQNTGLMPVSLSARVEGNILKVYVLGVNDGKGYKVRLKSEVVEEYLPEGEEVTVDNTLPDFQRVIVQEAKKGLKVLVYRETYNASGELIETEKISEDVYRPVKAKVKVNQKYFNDYKGLSTSE